jgi:hypothetical protein
VGQVSNLSGKNGTSYEASDEVTAYVDPVAVGDSLPDAPLFLSPGWYVYIPLETTYQTSWDNTPLPIRELVVPSALAGPQA